MVRVLEDPTLYTDAWISGISMSEHSTSPPHPAKPARPDGSPLCWHASGRWCKRIRGSLHYFGRGSHHDALAEYNRVGPDLHAGRRPRDEEPEGLTVRKLCECSLTAKVEQRDHGELSPRMCLEYGEVCRRPQRVTMKPTF